MFISFQVQKFYRVTVILEPATVAGSDSVVWFFTRARFEQCKKKKTGLPLRIWRK